MVERKSEVGGKCGTVHVRPNAFTRVVSTLMVVTFSEGTAVTFTAEITWNSIVVFAGYTYFRVNLAGFVRFRF